MSERDRRPGVTGGNQLLQSEPVEIQDEVFEEIGFERIVAVTEHYLAFEMLPVMRQFLFNVGELRINSSFLAFFA